MEHYQDLHGARGRDANFRAPRLGPERFPALTDIDIRLDDRPVRFNDISMTGLSVVDVNNHDDWTNRLGHSAELMATIEGVSVLSGPVDLVRMETFPGSVRLGVRFDGWCPDMEQLSDRHVRAATLKGFDAPEGQAPDLVPAAYKAICADVLHLLSWQRQALEPLEAQMKRDDERRASAQAVARAVEERLLQRWRPLWQAADQLVRGLDMDSPEFLAIKRYTEQVLTPALMPGAIWNRSYVKPRGYPGDYAIMKMVYAWAREGEGLADQMIHRIGLDVAECIATRMVLVQQALAETIERFGQDSPARVTSLGCGPAKEIENVLSSKRLGGRADFTLIDQDEEALEDTYMRLMPMVAAKHDQASLQMLQESFVGIVRGGAQSADIRGQHLIYTVGLVDYLRAGMARGLVSKLYQQLAPGGLLIIGNMADAEVTNFWPMEVLADWRVEYRTRDEMLDMARRCDGASVEVKRESTGRVWMLYIRKPE